MEEQLSFLEQDIKFRKQNQHPNKPVFYHDSVRIDRTTFFVYDEDKQEYIDKHDKENKTTFVSEKAIKILSPDHINAKIFWEKIVDNFPYISIIGDKKVYKNIDLLHKASFSIIKNFHEDLCKYINSNSSVLEIGPGYGSTLKYILDHINSQYDHINNYYMLDLIKLFNHLNLHIGDGYNLNKELYNFDFIFSFNCFQHLSKTQRSNYYKDIYNGLKDGGCFLFNMFLETEENKYKEYWGFKDKNGRNYTMFFNQLTEVDHEEELKEELKLIGFKKIEIFNTVQNVFGIKCFK